MELDFETKSSYMVMLTATDPSGASDMINVMITVTDEADDAVISVGPGDPPAFEANTASRSVLENMKGADVGDPVTATDATTYSLNSMYVAIDEDTGQITTKMALDYETKDTHVVTVVATNDVGTDSIRVTVTVEDAYPGCRYGSVETGELAAGLTNDCEALLDAKEDLGGSLNWDEETDLAAGEWEGIRFSADDRVAVIWLRDKGLDGTIPAALGRLDALTVLNLHSNMLTGSIPMELSYLTMLEELYLNNQDDNGEGLTGGIPAWLNNMTNIRELWLWGNDLGGEIPDLSGMSSLVRIKLGGNGLIGGVPTTWPESLVSLNVGTNDLGGEIPDLSGLTNLRYMWLHMNGLTGEIPASIGMMSSLFDLNLRNNMLTGSIPDLSGSESLMRGEPAQQRSDRRPIRPGGPDAGAPVPQGQQIRRGCLPACRRGDGGGQRLRGGRPGSLRGRLLDRPSKHRPRRPHQTRPPRTVESRHYREKPARYSSGGRVRVTPLLSIDPKQERRRTKNPAALLIVLPPTVVPAEAGTHPRPPIVVPAKAETHPPPPNRHSRESGNPIPLPPTLVPSVIAGTKVPAPPRSSFPREAGTHRPKPPLPPPIRQVPAKSLSRPYPDDGAESIGVGTSISSILNNYRRKACPVSRGR